MSREDDRIRRIVENIAEGNSYGEQLFVDSGSGELTTSSLSGDPDKRVRVKTDDLGLAA